MVEEMTTVEYAAWKRHRRKFGFTADRLEAAIALGCAKIAQMLGSRVSPQELVPDFRQSGNRVSNDVKIAGLSSVVGAQVTTGGRYRGK